MARVFVQVVCCVSTFIAVSALLVGLSSAQTGTNIVLYASEAPVKYGWNVVTDSAAAGGARLSNPNLGVAKLSAPLSNPAAYFEMSFNADSGRAYRLWIRGKAANNDWANDSVFVQFSGSVDSGGSASQSHWYNSSDNHQPRRLFGQRAQRMGLAGQRMGNGGDGTSGLFLHHR